MPGERPIWPQRTPRPRSACPNLTALNETSRRCSSPLPDRSPSRQKAAARGPGSLGLSRQLRPVRSSDVKRSTLRTDGQISECTTADQRQICGSSKSSELQSRFRKSRTSPPFAETSKRLQTMKECFNRSKFCNSVRSALEVSKIELVTDIVY